MVDHKSMYAHVGLCYGNQSIPIWPMLIDGRHSEGARVEYDRVYSPSLQHVPIADVPRADQKDLERAVVAARKAFVVWSAAHFSERQKAILDIADRIESVSEELAILTAIDTGNALRTQARPEVRTLAALFRYFGGVAGEFKGDLLPTGDSQLQFTCREPYGVVGAILPWNSPLMIAGMKIPAALAAGNTLVVKPAEDAPLTVLRLAEIASESLPEGALNVITGPGDTTGDALVRHPGVDKITFTGSSAVGANVGSVAGGRIIPLSLELGGKSANIVFPSAAEPECLDATVNGAISAMRFTRQGQSCTAGTRMFIHRSVFDLVLDHLIDAVKLLRVGDPLDEKTDMGAIINRTQDNMIKHYIREAENDESVRVLLDGSVCTVDGLDGFFQRPTIISGESASSWRGVREEIFGPVLFVCPWDDIDGLVKSANCLEYGLAAYIWTTRLDEALNTARRLDVGWIQINQGGGQAVGQSYGGYKGSGLGREFSLEGALDAFSQVKQINVLL